MRVIRNEKCIKIVPKKYKPVIEGFKFDSDKKRLSSSERHGLLQLLVKYSFQGSLKSTNKQIAYAAKYVTEAKSIRFLLVNKRNHTEYRIKANGVQIRVSEELIGDCPKEYLEVKYEF